MISTVFITKEIASIQIVKHILSAFETVSVHHLKPVGENQGISVCFVNYALKMIEVKLLLFI